MGKKATNHLPRYHYLMFIGNGNEFRHFGLSGLERIKVESLGEKANTMQAINALGDFGYRVAFAVPRDNSTEVTYLLERVY